MLEASPECSSAASPPASSQSSSVGSCYTSTSSQAAIHTRSALSDPSSNATSPASAYDRSCDPYHAADLAKRHPLSAETRAARPHPTNPLARNPRTTYHNQTHTAPSAWATSPRDPFTKPSVMTTPSSAAYSSYDSRDYHRAGPSHSSIANYPSQSPHHFQPGESPDNNRGPAPKARRTSPGGSRASGNLYPSQTSSFRQEDHSYQHHGASSHNLTTPSRSPYSSTSIPSSSHTSSSATATMSQPGVQSAAGWRQDSVGVDFGSYQPSVYSSAGHSAWQNASNVHESVAATSSSSTVPSPRTRADGSHVASADPPSAASQRPSIPSSGVSSSSATEHSDALSKSKPPSSLPKMDLATFPPQELLKILAALLSEIATANDDFQPDGSKDDSSRSRRGGRSRDRSGQTTPAESGDASAMHNYAASPGSHLSFSDSRRPSVTTAALGALATPSSTLCFHARNVPSISIESYLLRILKYCPTTNEVFLSLLVYFDRMSRMGTGAKPGANGEGEVAGEAAGLPRAVERATGHSDSGHDPAARTADTGASAVSTKHEQPYTHPGIRGFAIDSYNVHRLVIAGVTVASKFFSDVFYTNSRYAKVGGLPPHELNQLELQFLLLNDFRLTIPLEEMQRYADQLLMYGSGRPEMAKMTKDLTPAVPTTVSGSGADSGSRLAAGEPKVEGASAMSPTGSASTNGVDHPQADAEGDVKMSDTQ